jgi:translation initiation factor IF-2
MNWIEYWREFVFIAGLVGAWITGRKSKEIKLKTEGAGAIEALQKIYDKYIEHNSRITEELVGRVSQVEKHNRDLQKNFNEMHLSYAIVMGENQKLEAKYKELVKEYEQLKVDHDKLKLEFDRYKKANKL